MTKKLEELLDLPSSKEIIQQARAQEVDQKEYEIAQAETFRDIAEFDKIAIALPAVKGLGEMADRELNEIADKAMQAYDDLMDLGMNVEARFAGEIFNNASKMLETALSAKNNKINKKLKMIDLQLKKAQLDLKKRQAGEDEAVETDGIVMDRNALLNEILAKKA